jgi:hypothetical protein
LAITIPGNFGLAAEVYAEGEGSLDRIGVFPEEKFGGGNPGDNQPMNGSCMHSFAVAAGTKTITNG